MNVKDLPIEAMLPKISICRFFDTQTNPISQNLRVSDFYELSYYTEGGGEVFINGKNYPIGASDIRFTKPGSILSSHPPYKCYTVYFDFGGVAYKNAILDGIPEFFHSGADVLNYFQKLLFHFSSVEITAPAMQNSVLLELLCVLFKSVYSRKICSSAVCRCVEYINSNFSSHITLDELCCVSNYSKPHLLRLFKNEFGCSPHEYLSSIRLTTAKNLLSESNLSIPEIAALCGFASDSHFKSLFKKSTGITPGAYRKNTVGIIL